MVDGLEMRARGRIDAVKDGAACFAALAFDNRVAAQIQFCFLN